VFDVDLGNGAAVVEFDGADIGRVDELDLFAFISWLILGVCFVQFQI
jgi:hypothetical protein